MSNADQSSSDLPDREVSCQGQELLRPKAEEGIPSPLSSNKVPENIAD
jgi:hypothetical protein